MATSAPGGGPPKRGYFSGEPHGQGLITQRQGQDRASESAHALRLEVLEAGQCGTGVCWVSRNVVDRWLGG